MGAVPVSQDEIDNVAAIAGELGVTDAGARLLAVWMRPGGEQLPMTQQCGLADISQDTFYRLKFHDERMAKAITALNQGMVRAGTFDVTQAMLKKAREGDPICIKMVREEAGLLQPVVRHQHEHDLAPSLKEILGRRDSKSLKDSPVIDVEATIKE